MNVYVIKCESIVFPRCGHPVMTVQGFPYCFQAVRFRNRSRSVIRKNNALRHAPRLPRADPAVRLHAVVDLTKDTIQATHICTRYVCICHGEERPTVFLDRQTQLARFRSSCLAAMIYHLNVKGVADKAKRAIYHTINTEPRF